MLFCVLGAITSLASADAGQDILDQCQIKGGLVVHLGCGDGTLTASLGKNESFLVQGLDASTSNVERARRHIRSLGRYGRVSVDTYDGIHLPYVDNLVNLLVVDDPAEVSMDEMMRVLAPLGVVYIDGKKTVKARPSEIDEWTHFLHGPDNNAVAADSVVGPPRHMQWLADPLWIRHHGMLASVQAPVSAGGRLFFIMDKVWQGSTTNPPDWNLVARDAFNGKLLWESPIATWTDFQRGFRSGPVQVQRLLVADKENVYAVLGLDGPVTVLDAATGRVIRVLEGTERTEELIVHDGTLLAVTAAEKTEQAYDAKLGRSPLPLAVAESKSIQAVEPNTGTLLWQWPKKGTDSITPLTLAASGDSVYFQQADRVVCLDRDTGLARWDVETRKPDMSENKPGPHGVERRYGWSVATLVVVDGVVLSTNGQTLHAISADSGEMLWQTDVMPTFLSPVDVLVNDGQVWIGETFTRSRDLKTGAVAGENDLTAALLTATHHHRCYRNKATSRFIIMSKRGAEFIDMAADDHSRNNWVRGLCQYGMLPCNGLLYAPPHQCCCYMEAKLYGFWALAPTRRINVLPAENRLEKGPAYGTVSGASAKAPSEEWPFYRRDELRSGATPDGLGRVLRPAWKTKLADRLSAPVVAGGRLLVASMGTNQVFALNPENGEMAWSFTTGSRVDSPPSLFAGLVLFGSSDGKVYCLRASDGQLVWTFHAALGTEQTVVQERLESLWPVSGSVLIKDGVCYFASGRSSYLDGGLRLYGLDPFTGRVKYESEMKSEHAGAMTEIPKTAGFKGDYKTIHAPDKSDAFSMEGNLADILVSDGESIYLRHVKYNQSLVRQEGYGTHLFSSSSLLDRSEAERSHWFLGTGDFRRLPKSSYQWMTKPRHLGFGQFIVPFGTFLCFDKDTAWSVKQLEAGGGLRDALNLSCQSMRPLGIDEKDFAQREQPEPIWSVDLQIHPLAMLKAGPDLYVGGLALNDFSGRKDDYDGKAGVLKVFDASSGKEEYTLPLDSPPVFDGMAAAGESLYISTQDGAVLCLSGNLSKEVVR